MAQPNAAIPVLPALAAPPAPVTLLERFTQMPDVYNGSYQGLLAQYAANNTTSGAILEMTRRFPTTVPNVFLYSDFDGVIRTMSHIHSVEAVFGLPSRWDTATFGYFGDVIHGQATALTLSAATFFGAVVDVVVPTVANMEPLLTALPANTTFVGPFANGDADTEVVSTRRAVPLPHCYVPMVFNRTLSPTEAWQQLGLQIIADNREADCAILLTFLRCAATLTNVGDATPRVSTFIMHPPNCGRRVIGAPTSLFTYLVTRLVIRQRRKPFHPTTTGSDPFDSANELTSSDGRPTGYRPSYCNRSRTKVFLSSVPSNCPLSPQAL